MSAWPSISCSERRSQPPVSRWVANVWRSVCGLIRCSRPGAPGVAADDLVEALAGQPAAAQVDEHAPLGPQPDQLRPPPLEVRAQRLDRLAADRHDPLLGALAAGAQDAGLEVELGQLEADRLRRAQAAGVHRLEQRAVPQRRRAGSARLLEQPRHLVAAQHLRAAAPRERGARSSEAGSCVEDLLAAQVAVERAQAGDLALERGRRGGGPVRRAGRPARRRTRPDRPAVTSSGSSSWRVEEVARTAADRSGRPRACCATGRARARGGRGSRRSGR